ncbi:hypothetical protein VB711_02930 [Cronbergia sp. UHCC 0137]|uniref:hypothetical protein n=1 Tax=Cronbergia sp. UHCC 0137 TaxID=3110239 RepID=UPI002B1EEF85|nr:hypothetical protein [Cronbergia sp. UHCC 0137]MEA5616796.1 hypothetical protein [Cronbergia sp. UHCC 0137]
MPSPKIIELEQILQTYSIEDKQWLLEQLIQQLGSNNQQQTKEIISETISYVGWVVRVNDKFQFLHLCVR